MANQEIINALNALLSDSYVLYLKTQNFHWNVTGPNFYSLHQMFEEQYTELAAAIDDIAEHIRSLGAMAPGSYQQFLQHTKLKEADSGLSADDMIVQLISDHGVLIDTSKLVVKESHDRGDVATEDFAIGRIKAHQKTLWMLKSLLAK